MNRPVIALLAVFMFPLTFPALSAGQSAPAVEWTQLVKVTAASGSVTKTAGCNDCPDAGAISTARLTGDGFAEFVPIAGHRVLAGLGADLSASTSWTTDFAFSISGNGTWEIREQGVYRKDGVFAPGDRFRIAVQGGAVTYLRNGAVVYSSSLAPVFPLVLDTVIFTVGGGISESVLGPLDGAGTIEPPASDPGPEPEPGTPDTSGYYSAIVDRVARPEPPLPAIGGAGTEIVDPTFHTRVIRLTDGATRPGHLNRSYRTPSSAHQHSWSAAGSYFYVMSTDGTIVPFRFDGASGAASRIDASPTGEGGFVLRFFNEPQFSYVNDNLIYGTYIGPGTTIRTIDQYDFSTRAYSKLIDLDTLVPNLAGTYVGWIGSSAGAVERIATFFGAASQDRHYLALVFDKQDPAKRTLVDTKASLVNGRPTNIPLNFSIHAMGIDRSGRYAMLYTTWTDMAEPRKAAPSYLWDLATDTFTELPLIAAGNGGHDVYGYGVRINQDRCTSTSWDAAQWQFRALDSPFATRDVIQPVLLPKKIYLADHASWHNARPDVHVPFISAIYRSALDTVETRAWDDEIVGVQPDAPSGTAATVWRFAHHRSDGTNDIDPNGVSFWYMPRPSVSSDGRWVLFTSNWEKTLGAEPGADPSTAFRQDVFAVRLQANDPGAPPPPPDEPPTDPEPPPVDPTPVASIAIAETTLPDAVRKTAYSAALVATDAQGAVTWSVSAGSLPSGLSLNASSGVISGTCGKTGKWTFTISATDEQASASRLVTIQVRPN